MEQPNIENQIPQESKEQKETPVLRVVVSRHGPKASASGEKNARAAYFDESVKSGFADMKINDGLGLVRVNTSPVDRAVKTAEIFNEELEKTLHRQIEKISERSRLAVPYQPGAKGEDEKFAHDFEAVVAMQKELEPSVCEKIEKSHPKLSDIEQESLVRNELDQIVIGRVFHESAPGWHGERKFVVPYQHVADRMAGRYLGFLRHGDLLKNLKEQSALQPNDEPFISVDVSHSFLIMSFLKKYLIFSDDEGNSLPAEEMTPEDFFERTGGVMGESQSFVMDYVPRGDKMVISVSGEFTPGKKFTGIINPSVLSGEHAL